jgi:hypothetical protein
LSFPGVVTRPGSQGHPFEVAGRGDTSGRGHPKRTWRRAKCGVPFRSVSQGHPCEVPGRGDTSGDTPSAPGGEQSAEFVFEACRCGRCTVVDSRVVGINEVVKRSQQLLRHCDVGVVTPAINCPMLGVWFFKRVWQSAGVATRLQIDSESSSVCGNPQAWRHVCKLIQNLQACVAIRRRGDTSAHVCKLILQALSQSARGGSIRAARP